MLCFLTHPTMLVRKHNPSSLFSQIFLSFLFPPTAPNGLTLLKFVVLMAENFCTAMAARKPGLIALFDVDGTLTAPRKVPISSLIRNVCLKALLLLFTVVEFLCLIHWKNILLYSSSMISLINKRPLETDGKRGTK